MRLAPEQGSVSMAHADHEGEHDHRHALSWREINRVLFVAAAAGAIWFLQGASNPYLSALGVLCTLVGGFPIFHEAYENILQRRMTMELSMAIAIVAALAIREIFTALPRRAYRQPWAYSHSPLGRASTDNGNCTQERIVARRPDK
jgi:Cd2+/Zn2+-exporting ATPase/Cu+-exporting ATPase